MKGCPHHSTGLRLAVETPLFVLLMGAWLWGIVALGAHATAARVSPSDGDGSLESAVVSCPAPSRTEEGGSSAVTGNVCRPEPRIHAGTSRQPGRGLPGGQARETVDRIPEETLSGRRPGGGACTESGG